LSLILRVKVRRLQTHHGHFLKTLAEWSDGSPGFSRMGNMATTCSQQSDLITCGDWYWVCREQPLEDHSAERQT
jgi:hypothetical protein